MAQPATNVLLAKEGRFGAAEGARRHGREAVMRGSSCKLRMASRLEAGRASQHSHLELPHGVVALLGPFDLGNLGIQSWPDHLFL